MTPPILSVLMPVFNSAEFLAQAISSICNQTYEGFEFIIVDDGSTDGTPEIIRHYANVDSRIIPIHLNQNVGVAQALNHGFSRVRGRYIARMDGEDISLPERLMKQVAFLEQHPEIGLVGTQTAFIDENGAFTEQPDWIKPLSHNSLVWHLLYDTPICHPSVMARTHIIRNIGGYDPRYPNEDMQLWTRLSFVTRLANLDEILLYYRMPPQRHKSRLLYWEPHVQRVAREFMELILERVVDPGLVETLYLFQKYKGQLPESSPPNLEETLQLCTLLEELFHAMFAKGVLILDGLEDVSPLMCQQIRQLLIHAVKERNLLKMSRSF